MFVFFISDALSSKIRGKRQKLRKISVDKLTSLGGAIQAAVTSKRSKAHSFCKCCIMFKFDLILFEENAYVLQCRFKNWNFRSFTGKRVYLSWLDWINCLIVDFDVLDWLFDWNGKSLFVFSDSLALMSLSYFRKVALKIVCQMNSWVLVVETRRVWFETLPHYRYALVAYIARKFWGSFLCRSGQKRTR